VLSTLADLEAASWDDAIFLGESLPQEQKSPALEVKACPKILHCPN